MDIVEQLRECAGDYSLFDKDVGREAADEITRLRSDLALAQGQRDELEVLRADATRYRWLREQGGGSWHLTPEIGGVPFKATGQYFDAAIDAAMQKGE